MWRKEYVEVPEKPDIELFVLLDRPGTIYINLTYPRLGIIRIVSADDEPHEIQKE